MRQFTDKMDKNIHITVSGCANTGKSTIMYRIIELLRNDGFDVELDSPLTMMDYGTEKKFTMQMEMNKDLRMEAVMKKTKVIIGEKQLVRDFIKAEKP